MICRSISNSAVTLNGPFGKDCKTFPAALLPYARYPVIVTGRYMSNTPDEKGLRLINDRISLLGLCLPRCRERGEEVDQDSKFKLAQKVLKQIFAWDF